MTERLPKTIYIGPFDFEVKLTKSRHFRDLGETDSEDTRIYIKAKQAESQKRDTLMHEVLHAIIFSAGISKTSELSHEAGERLIVALSPWLTQFLRDNPEAVAYLQSE